MLLFHFPDESSEDTHRKSRCLTRTYPCHSGFCLGSNVHIRMSAAEPFSFEEREKVESTFGFLRYRDATSSVMMQRVANGSDEKIDV